MITDASNEQLWVAVEPPVTRQILGVSSASEWLRIARELQEQGSEALNERVLELAKESIAGDSVLLSWIEEDQGWTIVSLA